MSRSSSEPVNPKEFEAKLHSRFGMPPTDGQNRLFYTFTRFMFSDRPRCALLVKGYAGTGKTTSVRAMVQTLSDAGISSVLLAPTGRAAKVLASYTGVPAWTIHRHIYQQRGDRSGRIWFDLKENLLENTIFFVDEASMIGSERSASGMDEWGSGDLLEDLMHHVYSGTGCRLVLIGDAAQLPPVGSDHSPALDLAFLRDRYDLNIAELELTEVVRQEQESGILFNATQIRSLIAAGTADLPVLKTEGYPDITRITGDLQPVMEEMLREYGKDDLVIITRSNKRANLFNQQMRGRILWFEEEINSSDRMMVLRNNYFWLQEVEGNSAGFIANGDVLEIVRIRRFEERGQFRFCRAVVRFVDYPDIPEQEVLLLCDTIWGESASLSSARMMELRQEIARDYEDLSPQKQRKAIKEDPYYNALHVKFAYAITAHKAQGGQWPCVFVDQGYLSDEMITPELNRWFYTAFTRAQERLFLVGFEEKFFTVKAD